MSFRVGVVSAAHVHAPSFVSCLKSDPGAEVVGIWDDDSARGKAFAEKWGLSFVDSMDSLLGDSQAVVVCSENMKHAGQISAAVEAGKHVLCEKPIVPVREQLEQVSSVVASAKTVTMTAFPCPFSPTFGAMKGRVSSGELGDVLAVCATNQGTCPGGWFTDSALSGGGAMVDHTVHVADLLRRVLGEDPVWASAQIGNGMYGQSWEDTAMVTVGFGSGVFATIDSSWSIPKGYKTWGNVKLNVVGSKGVVEADLFVQGVDVYGESGARRVGTGSNLDALMVREFLAAIEEDRTPTVTLEDGIWASRVAMAAYESARSGGEKAAV